jgi:hypothetical protein
MDGQVAAAAQGHTESGAGNDGKTTEQQQTPEQKAAADKAAADKATADKAAADKAAADKAAADAAAKAGSQGAAGSKDGAAAQQPKAPAKYTLSIPDDRHIDETDLARIEAFARAKDLSNDEAQAYVGQLAEARKTDVTRFLDETKADPEYGGDKLEETQKLARQALEKLRPAGTPRGDALRRLLDKEGYGNSIHFISLLADIGKLMAEDRPIGSLGGSRTDRDPADVLYSGKSA